MSEWGVWDMKLDFCAICGATEDLQQHHIEPVVWGGIERHKKKKYNINVKLGSADYKDCFARLFDLGIISDDGEITVCYYHHNLLHGIIRFHKVEHSNLVKEGLRKAKEGGKTLGRPATPKETVEEFIKLRGDGLSYREIGKETGVSATCVYRVIKKGSSGSDRKEQTMG
tara:strand:- start:18 stop:527 length:510 start_codon:yes stop_codon:yes gene_type:complete